jgi:nitroimidazol reductase NimA-like FMN-containing flavoprotein (pyridoxamine 5'-phosphate oxidase superfamily)
LIDGLMGIAHGGDRSEAAIKTAHSLIFPFDRERLEKLNFKEKVELINAICVADLLDEPKTKKIAKSIV